MIEPPLPGIPNDFLTAVARLLWRFVVRAPSGEELGEFYESAGAARPIVAGAGAGLGTIQWVLASATAPLGVAPHLMSRHTATVLQEGRLDGDGSIIHEGKRYGVRAIWNGVQHVAEAFQLA